MKKILGKIIHLVKEVFSYPYYKNLYLQNTIKRINIKNEKIAIVNFDKRLRHDDFFRYYYIICEYLKEAEFKVVVKCHLSDFKLFKLPPELPFEFQKLFLKSDYIFVRHTSTPLNTIVLAQPCKANHIIRLYYGYSITLRRQFDCIAPYSMYPTQYKYYSDPNFVSELNKTNRTIKIFFSGLVNKNLYKNVRIKTYFNVINRFEVIQFILIKFEKRTRLLKSDSNKTVFQELLDSQQYINEIVISEVKTEQKDWLKILSKTDFFVCPPGVFIPWSHNCIEAMATGSIPILEYAHLFNPALINNKNCLTYSNYKELNLTIERALDMNQDDVENMRKNVLQYHDEFLSLKSITRRIKAFSNSSKEELKVALPFIPTKAEWAAQHFTVFRFLKTLKL